MARSYEGIINYNWAGSKGRIRMPLEQRAKIFAPLLLYEAIQSC